MFAFQHIKLIAIAVLLALSSHQAFSQAETNTATEKQKTIYFFSGLGADSTPFANLKLPGYKRVYISWEEPLPDESLHDYAGRLSSQVTEKDPYIIGLSFGGVVAVELAKQIHVEKMVLISSVKTSDELNTTQNFFMRLGLYKIIPGFLLKHPTFLTHMYFGAHTERDKRALMKLLKGTNVTLFRWGLKSIATWDNKDVPPRTIQINGTADKVMTYRFARPDYSIKGGGHLMVLNQADTISKIIRKYFSEKLPGTE